MSAMDYAVQAKAPGRAGGRSALVMMALAALVFVGSAAVKPGQALQTDPVAAAFEPVSAALDSSPEALVPGDLAVAAVEGAGQAAAAAMATIARLWPGISPAAIDQQRTQ